MIEALEKKDPGIGRRLRAAAHLHGSEWPAASFIAGSLPGFDLLARFVGEQQRLYPDAPAAKEVARRFLQIIQGADPAAVLELKKPPRRPKGSRRVDPRVDVAMHEYLDKHPLPLKRGTLSRACAVVAEKLNLEPKTVRRRWKTCGGDAYEWNRWLRDRSAKVLLHLNVKGPRKYR